MLSEYLKNRMNSKQIWWSSGEEVDCNNHSFYLGCPSQSHIWGRLVKGRMTGEKDSCSIYYLFYSYSPIHSSILIIQVISQSSCRNSLGMSTCCLVLQASHILLLEIKEKYGWLARLKCCMFVTHLKAQKFISGCRLWHSDLAIIISISKQLLLSKGTFIVNFILLRIYFWNQSDDDWRRGDVWRLVVF